MWELRLQKIAYRLEEPSTNDPSTSSFAVTTESETETDTNIALDVEQPPQRLKSRKITNEGPILPETIITLYLGLLLLRQPITLATIYKWLIQGDVPYIRVIRCVPEEIKDRMPGEYHEALDTQTLPTSNDLQRTTYDLAAMYGASFGLLIPPINHSHLLFQYIKVLALPLDIYPAVRRLNKIVHYDFTYASTTSKRRSATSYPEVQLMALVVVATKLLYPFNEDNTERNVGSLNELGATKLDWKAWIESKTKYRQDHDGFQHKREVEVKDTDIFEMTDKQLDDYMKWYQQTWTVEMETDNVSKQILSMFPLDARPERQSNIRNDEPNHASQRAKDTQSNMSPRQVMLHRSNENVTIEQNDVLPLGAGYVQYRNLSDLAEHAGVELFHQGAAELACVDVRTLLRAIQQAERVLILWRKAKRRAAAFGEDGEADLMELRTLEI